MVSCGIIRTPTVSSYPMTIGSNISPHLIHTDIITMPSRTITTQAVLALSLVLLLVMVWHTSSLLTGTEPQAGFKSESTHSSLSTDTAPSCSWCADHRHSPMTADHMHETPYLGPLLILPAQAENNALAAMPDQATPVRPIYLIERPPRSRYVI